jgi:hypothetical protein
MGLSRRAIDDLRIGCIGCDQGLEQALPKPTPRPPVEAIVDRRRRSVDSRAVLPSAAHLQHMHDAADHSTVVDPTSAWLIARQQRFDRRPLPIVEPELARHLQCSVVSELESLLVNKFNALIEF